MVARAVGSALMDALENIPEIMRLRAEWVALSSKVKILWVLHQDSQS